MAFRLFRKWDAATEAEKLESAENSDQAPPSRHPLTWPVFRDHIVPIMKHPLVAIPLIFLLLTPIPAFLIDFDRNGITYRLSGGKAPIWMGFVQFFWLVIPGAVVTAIVPIKLDKALRQSGYTPDFRGCVAGLVYVVLFAFGLRSTIDYVLDLAQNGYALGPLGVWSAIMAIFFAAAWFDGYHLTEDAAEEPKPSVEPESDEMENTTEGTNIEGKDSDEKKLDLL